MNMRDYPTLQNEGWVHCIIMFGYFVYSNNRWAEVLALLLDCL